MIDDLPLFVRPRMVDAVTCSELVEFTDRALGAQPTDSIAALKYEQVMPTASTEHARIKRLMNSFRYSAIHQVRGHFDGVGRAFPSTTLLTLWFPGQGLAPHCDTDTWWRTYTTICYLNDDFQGGELEFIKYERTIRPEPGLFIAFPSADRRCQHLVYPVQEGRRYTISMFQTNQLERAEL